MIVQNAKDGGKFTAELISDQAGDQSSCQRMGIHSASRC